ncbi:unnamed protein product [Prorocentrum cordatum]|uniref:EF-hand domain-containing protein n=1 Tax=Prorocentrum cordatum TaxID=2364126 RepID=A0ABN9UJ53_9DINO|nr:unnamed protein product [Polarella glacialis]
MPMSCSCRTCLVELRERGSAGGGAPREATAVSPQRPAMAPATPSTMDALKQAREELELSLRALECPSASSAGAARELLGGPGRGGPAELSAEFSDLREMCDGTKEQLRQCLQRLGMSADAAGGQPERRELGVPAPSRRPAGPDKPAAERAASEAPRQPAVSAGAPEQRAADEVPEVVRELFGRILALERKAGAEAPEASEEQSSPPMVHTQTISTRTFNLGDEDSDGALNIREFDDLCKRLGLSWDSLQVGKCFAELDKDEDNQIQLSEWRSAYRSTSPKKLGTEPEAHFGAARRPSAPSRSPSPPRTDDAAGPAAAARGSGGLPAQRGAAEGAGLPEGLTEVRDSVRVLDRRLRALEEQAQARTGSGGGLWTASAAASPSPASPLSLREVHGMQALLPAAQPPVAAAACPGSGAAFPADGGALALAAAKAPPAEWQAALPSILQRLGDVDRLERRVCELEHSAGGALESTTAIPDILRRLSQLERKISSVSSGIGQPGARAPALAVAPSRENEELFDRVEVVEEQAKASRHGLQKGTSTFVMSDTNYDGTLDLSEFARLVEQLELAWDAEQVKRVFAELDGNGDSLITQAEWQAALKGALARRIASRHAGGRAATPPWSPSSFGGGDVNRDGKLDQHEFRRLVKELNLPWDSAFVQRCFASLDTNKDDVITLAEWEAALGGSPMDPKAAAGRGGHPRPPPAPADEAPRRALGGAEEPAGGAEKLRAMAGRLQGRLQGAAAGGDGGVQDARRSGTGEKATEFVPVLPDHAAPGAAKEPIGAADLRELRGELASGMGACIGEVSGELRKEISKHMKSLSRQLHEELRSGLDAAKAELRYSGAGASVAARGSPRPAAPRALSAASADAQAQLLWPGARGAGAAAAAATEPEAPREQPLGAQETGFHANGGGRRERWILQDLAEPGGHWPGLGCRILQGPADPGLE